MEKYEKPTLKFESLQLFESIADNVSSQHCWRARTLKFSYGYDSFYSCGHDSSSVTKQINMGEGSCKKNKQDKFLCEIDNLINPWIPLDLDFLNYEAHANDNKCISPGNVYANSQLRGISVV